MATVKPGQTITRVFSLRSFAGTPVDDDNTPPTHPIGTLYKNGASDATTVTITRLAVGRYNASYTVPSNAATGDSFQVLIQAQIALIGYEGIPEGMHDIVDTKLISDLNDLAVGAAMTLTSDYDAAKTAATVGAKMDLVNAPNSTAVTAIASADATAVWGATVRALSSGGVTAIASAVATAVWAASTRTLTSFGTLVADTTSAVWSAVVRTITGGGGGSGGASAADIWGYTGGSGRTLSATPASPTNVTDAEAAILAAISEIPGGGGGSGATVMISDPGVTIE